VYPVLHEKEHALPTQTGSALATLVVQAWPHVAQLFGSLERSTQLLLQFVGVAAGHDDVHENVPASLLAHSPALPVHA
jgi:hypothetical protein